VVPTDERWDQLEGLYRDIALVTLDVPKHLSGNRHRFDRVLGDGLLFRFSQAVYLAPAAVYALPFTVVSRARPCSPVGEKVPTRCRTSRCSTSSSAPRALFLDCVRRSQSVLLVDLQLCHLVAGHDRDATPARRAEADFELTVSLVGALNLGDARASSERASKKRSRSHSFPRPSAA